MGKTSLGLFVFFLVSGTTSALATAGCAVPLYAPLASERQNWKELESLAVNKSLNSGIEFVQGIADKGHGALNLDFYSVTIDANGQSASQLMKDLRLNLNEVMFKGTTYGLAAYDAANEAKWKSADPKGALMTFTLAGVEGVMPLERGSVVVSCFSTESFVFSTVKTAKDGLHPVAGSRAFGVHDHGNGSLSIYVKAADRVVNEGLFAALGAGLQEKVFEQGHTVWLRLMDNLEAKFKDRHPRDRFVHSVRLPY